MNKVVGRARIMLVLIIVLAGGMLLFVGEYFARAGEWVMFPGSPHIYSAGNIGCGMVTDREGYLLLDMTGGRLYPDNQLLKRSTVHWLGDRNGSISAPAVSHYASKVAGFNVFDGVYSYGGTGGQVQLTLSAKIQMAAAEALGDYHGTVAVYNYKSGELICAVSGPNFDPDDPPDISNDTEEIYKGLYVNRFTQSKYTPGSIFKIVTAAAALEHIPDIMERTLECTGERAYGIDVVTCPRAHGTMTLKEAFGNSCNCAFAQLADMLGGSVLERYVKDFGVLDSISFDGISTAAGSIEAAAAAPVQVAWSAIGQHKDLVNPCAYLNFVGAIAADGLGVQTQLVSRVTVGDTVTYQMDSGNSKRIMSTKTAQTMKEIMRSAVEYNYGGVHYFGSLPVCAKTGTAEVGDNQLPTATFAGFVDDADLPLAFIAIAENAGAGSTVCIPIIAEILEACVDEMK